MNDKQLYPSDPTSEDLYRCCKQQGCECVPEIQVFGCKAGNDCYHNKVKPASLVSNPTPTLPEHFIEFVEWTHKCLSEHYFASYVEDWKVGFTDITTNNDYTTQELFNHWYENIKRK